GDGAQAGNGLGVAVAPVDVDGCDSVVPRVHQIAEGEGEDAALVHRGGAAADRERGRHVVHCDAGGVLGLAAVLVAYLAPHATHAVVAGGAGRGVVTGEAAVACAVAAVERILQSGRIGRGWVEWIGEAEREAAAFVHRSRVAETGRRRDVAHGRGDHRL